MRTGERETHEDNSRLRHTQVSIERKLRGQLILLIQVCCRLLVFLAVVVVVGQNYDSN